VSAHLRTPHQISAAGKPARAIGMEEEQEGDRGRAAWRGKTLGDAPHGETMLYCDVFLNISIQACVAP
jgi:hypothetical protein